MEELAKQILDSLAKNKSNTGIILLTLFDILAGVLSLFIVAFTIPAIAGSIILFLKLLRPAIQYKKVINTLRKISPAIGAYIAIRKKQEGGVHFMEKLKKLGIAIWGNKFTGIELAVSAGAGYTAYILIPFAYINIIVAAIVFLLSSYLIVSGKVGVESVQQITDRIAKVKLTKAELEKKKRMLNKKLYCKKQKQGLMPNL